MKLILCLVCVQILTNDGMNDPSAGRGMASEYVEPSAYLPGFESQQVRNVIPPSGITEVHARPIPVIQGNRQVLEGQQIVHYPQVIPSGYEEVLPGARCQWNAGNQQPHHEAINHLRPLNPQASEFSPNSNIERSRINTGTERTPYVAELETAFAMMSQNWLTASTMNMQLIENLKTITEQKVGQNNYNSYRRTRYYARKDEARKEGRLPTEKPGKHRSFEYHRKRYLKWGERMQKKEKEQKRTRMESSPTPRHGHNEAPSTSTNQEQGKDQPREESEID